MGVLNNVVPKVAAITLSLLLLPLSPLFLLLSGLIYLYRGIASRVAKWADPSLGELLQPASAIHAAERPNSNPSCLVVIAHYLSGRLDEPTLISSFQKLILSKELYPELRQRVVIKFGFHFWRNEECFKISDHIRSYVDHEDNNQPGAVNSQQLMKIMEKLLAAPFQPGRSPWELLLLPHFQDTAKPTVHSVLIYRGHHCLADGLSVHSLISKLCFEPPVFPPYPAVPKVPLLSKIGRFLVATPFIYYEFLKVFLDQDSNYWTKKRASSARGRYKVGDFDVTSVERLKGIKNRHQVSMTAVINTIFISGFLKLAKFKGKGIPRANLSLPLPLPGHPDQLTNHYTACSVQVKFGDDGSSVTLLKSVDTSLSSLKRLPASVQLGGYRLMETLNGNLPVSLIRKPRHLPPITFVLSNMAAPLKQADVCGVPVEEMSVSMKPPENMTFTSFAQSYNGSFKFSVTADECLLEQTGDLEIFLEGMKESLEELSPVEQLKGDVKRD